MKLLPESLTELIKTISIVVSIIAVIVGGYITYNQYIDKKNDDENKSYFEDLSNIESEELIKQKAALYDLLRFKSRYHEIAPILIDFLYDKYLKNENELIDTATNVFILMQYPVSMIVKENINRKRFNFSQCIITHFLMKNIGERLESANFGEISLEKNSENNINLSNLYIHNINFKKASFVNISFNGTSFSRINLENALFENCEFWGTSFIDRTKLKNTTFRNCFFKDCYFSIDLKEASFLNCNVTNIKVSDEALIDRKKL